MYIYIKYKLQTVNHVNSSLACWHLCIHINICDMLWNTSSTRWSIYCLPHRWGKVACQKKHIKRNKNTQLFQLVEMNIVKWCNCM